MTRAVQITFDCRDPFAQARFWAEVLGYVIPGPPGRTLESGDDPFEAWTTFLENLGVPLAPEDFRAAIEDPQGRGPRVFFQIVPEDKIVKNRVHLDVRAAPGLQGDDRMAALESECERLKTLGADRLQRVEPHPPMEAGFIVMADPEGNEFCLD
ncbi:VOC family protein [Brevibacterium sp. ZH18]|uniref:VOC family protein n=1 Tax=Brevibacterium sp. ZH18 TaxID=2927784 RepID=UPI001F6222DE|nr:VOC family protein [Brevibacterium sp. ZH18]MCI4012567.1 VOC family protein [Brevibacterium sp. ZH18]